MLPPRPVHARFGGVIGDVTDPFVDVLTSIRDRIPLEDIGIAFRDVAYALGDAAKFIGKEAGSPKQIILRVVSFMGWPGFLASFIPGVGAVLGNWLVTTLPIAVPIAEQCLESGSIAEKGECSYQVLAAEIAWRYKMLTIYTEVQHAVDYAEQLSKMSEAPNIDLHVDKARFDQAVEDLKQKGLDENEATKQAIKLLHLMPSDLASACAAASGKPCREDAIAAFINAKLGRQVFDLAKFDLVSGSSFGVPEADLALPQNLSAEEYRRRIGDAQLHGSPPPVVDELRRLLDAAIAREEEATVPLSDRWRTAEEKARAAPADATLRKKADDLRIAYEASTTPADRLRDASNALATARDVRARAGRRQPPTPPVDLVKLDNNVQALESEVGARFRQTPLLRGSVRVMLDPTPTRRLRQAGTIVLLSSPLWGYAIYRHRHAVLSALRGLLP